MKNSNKRLSKNLTYAIYTKSGKFIFKKQFNSQDALANYLNERASARKNYFAIALTGSSRKVSRALIKKFEENIEKAKPFLYARDIANLKALVKILIENPAKEGMIKAAMFPAIVREEIPSEIWMAMGGETR